MSKRSRSPSTLARAENTTSSSIAPQIGDLGDDSPPSKYRSTSEVVPADQPGSIQCSLLPHQDTVYCCTPEEYELHYLREHSNRCSSCSKNFPSAHILSLHIDENHNVLREARAAKGERTYQCFVEQCERVCSTPQKRRLHLIDKHLFPRTYNFRIVDHGVDKTSSLLKDSRKRRVSTAGDIRETNRHPRPPPGQPARHHGIRERSNVDDAGLDQGSHLTSNVPGSQTTADASSSDEADNESMLDQQAVEVNDLTNAMSALRFVPPSVARLQRVKARPGRSSDAVKDGISAP